MALDHLVFEKREEILQIASQHGARNVRVIRVDKKKGQREISFLVDFDSNWSVIDQTRLILDLQNLLGCRVDVFAEQGLHWYVRDRVLADTLPL
jgi:predicted nucleotidyltransferase